MGVSESASLRAPASEVHMAQQSKVVSSHFWGVKTCLLATCVQPLVMSVWRRQRSTWRSSQRWSAAASESMRRNQIIVSVKGRGAREPAAGCCRRDQRLHAPLEQLRVWLHDATASEMCLTCGLNWKESALSRPLKAQRSSGHTAAQPAYAPSTCSQAACLS